MAVSGAAPRYAPTAESRSLVTSRSSAVGALSWAVLMSTLHRIRRGEGALLAINLSLIAYRWDDARLGLLQALVSTLAILVMYAFNDVYDAPDDWNNPKKDQALIGTWIEHRTAGLVVTVLLKVLTFGVALLVLGPGPGAAVASVMVVNVLYSTLLKGVPVADIVIVAVWGALYAAIVDPSAPITFLVALMTAICHLFQVLDDRTPDAANGIETTAVRSLALSRNLLTGLSLLLFVALRGPLGVVGALTAFMPLAIFFAISDAGAGWLLTKAYFAVVWLAVLGIAGAAG
jgi:4-hydroxybenzoate polyprenyltransferase